MSDDDNNVFWIDDGDAYDGPIPEDEHYITMPYALFERQQEQIARHLDQMDKVVWANCELVKMFAERFKDG